jgi:hypothetical protein
MAQRQSQSPNAFPPSPGDSTWLKERLRADRSAIYARETGSLSGTAPNHSLFGIPCQGLEVKSTRGETGRGPEGVPFLPAVTTYRGAGLKGDHVVAFSIIRRLPAGSTGL